MTRFGWCCSCLVLSCLSGCAGGDRVAEMRQRTIPEATPSEVVEAVGLLLKREFGRVAVDRERGRVETAPVEYVTARESGTARDLYRGRSVMRRRATCVVGRSAGQTVAWLRIDVERRDTERQAAMQPRAHRLGDSPGQLTPIDDDAATTVSQNAVWTFVRRDAELERALLDELRTYFAPVVETGVETGTEVPGVE
ncbi:MAG: hypothetical protein IPM18_11540 [Phycisphaerales bacterium]|nr:hypothetical protein [Phycisphaerales bacterium]